MSKAPQDFKRGRLTMEERARVETLADAGLNAGQIARRMNRHPGTINFAMHSLGLREPTERTFNYVRNGVRVVSFSKEEDAYIQALRVQGLTVERIAELATKRFAHPRNAATVNIRLKMLANREGDAA